MDEYGLSSEKESKPLIDKPLVTKDTAHKIAELLKSPDLPESLKDGLEEGLTQLYNADIDQSEINEH